MKKENKKIDIIIKSSLNAYFSCIYFPEHSFEQTMLSLMSLTVSFRVKKVRMHWRLSTILKTSNKCVSSKVFRYVKVCIFWKYIQYTIHWNKTQMLKKVPSDKINGTKYGLFFLSRTPTHHSFIFNLQFLYELKHKVRLFKIVCEIFHFQFRFVFIKVYMFIKFLFSLIGSIFKLRWIAIKNW